MKPRTAPKTGPPQQRSIETRLFLAELPPITCEYNLDSSGDEVLSVALRALDISPDGQYEVECELDSEDSVPLDLSSPTPLRTLDFTRVRALIVRNLGLPAGPVDISKWYLDSQDYEISTRCLGSGGHGRVYQATHKITKEAVAVKKVGDDEELSYQREVVNSATVRHPTLLPLIGCTPFSEHADPKGMIITPLMETGSLQGIIEQVRRGATPVWWTTTTKLKILLGIAIGVKTLWDHRVFHRDLKPQNILLDGNHEPKLCDFGQSKYSPLGTSRHNTGGMGTPMYSSPEVIRGEAYGFKADVFAFGLMMYSVWAGDEPFVAPPRRTLTLQQLNQMLVSGTRPTFPPGTPEPLVSLAKRCWDDSPELRPEIGEIVEGLHDPILLAAVPDLSHFDYREYGERILLFQELAECRAECGALKAELLESRRECEQLRLDHEQGRQRPRPLVKRDWAFGPTALRRLDDWNWVEANGAEAIEHFEQSAMQENAEDENNYGLCLLHGIGTAVDEVEAARYFELSAMRGNVYGQYNFGLCLLNGIGIDQKDSQAAHFFMLSAEQGYREAQNRYGVCLLKGIGIPKNLQLAVTFFQRAAEQGNSDAEWRYGLCLQRGNGIDKNSKLAVTFFERAANQANPDGELLFGRCLLNGIGVAKDPPRGAALLRRSAIQRNAEARWRYAICLRDGVGVEKSDTEAVKFFRGAAAQGNAEGQYYYGLCFRDGIGTDKNLERAETHLQKAAGLGHRLAREAHDELVHALRQQGLVRPATTMTRTRTLTAPLTGPDTGAPLPPAPSDQSPSRRPPAVQSRDRGDSPSGDSSTLSPQGEVRPPLRRTQTRI
jgi:TPR repeat protein/serine/threonine protein kinase